MVEKVYIGLLMLVVGVAVGQPSPFPEVVEVNFGTGITCSSGELKDSGEGYGPRGDGYIFGWVLVGTSTAQGNAGARVRTGTTETCEELSLNHLQYNDCCSGNGYNGHLEWMMAVPNGRYRVSVVMGDINKDSVHFMRSGSGVVILPPTRPTAKRQHFSGSAVVDVTDGKLRLSAEDGGNNAKINHAKIETISTSGGGSGPTPTPSTSSSATTNPTPSTNSESTPSPAPSSAATPVSTPPIETASPEDGPCVPNPSRFSPLAISPLRCDLVLTKAPYVLTFAGNQPGIRDSNNVRTGFRSLIPASATTAYNPSALTLTGGHLNLVAGTDHYLNGRRHMVNNIGVGLDVPAKELRLKARLKIPSRYATGSERVCLTFVVSERDHVLLCLQNRQDRDFISMRYEFDDVKIGSIPSARIGALNTGDRFIQLQMDIFPAENKVVGYYKLDGDDLKFVAEKIVDPYMMNKDQAATDTIVQTRTHGGVMAFRSSSQPPVTYEIHGFEVLEIPPVVTVPGDGDRVDFNVWKVHDVYDPTSMSWAPDGKLFVAQATGEVTVITFNAARTAVVSKITYNPIGPRLLLGIKVDWRYGVDGNDCVWLAHSHMSRASGVANSGRVTKVCGPTMNEVTDVIFGLPRAIANHALNNLEWGPPPHHYLYITCGSNAAAGGVNTNENSFLTRPEQPRSAAILRADVMNPSFYGDCTPMQDPDEMDRTGIASEVAATCDVEVYATGTRNPFDCVYHTNGHLYCTNNGVGGSGSVPPRPPGWQQGDKCDGIITGDQIAIHDAKIRVDALFDIVQGKYYGHPNPSRRECILDAGNPTQGRDGDTRRLPIADNVFQRLDFFNEFDVYPVGTQPDPNYKKPTVVFGRNHSPDGIIQYRSNAMCGALKDELLVVYYSVSPQVHRLKLSADGESVVADSTLIKSNIQTGADVDLGKPLGIEQDDKGTIFVSEFGNNQISVMVPKPVTC